MKGLIIGNNKERYGNEWLNLILKGEKTGEIRGSICKHRGTVALIESGSNLILGTVDIVDCVQITNELEWNLLKAKHCVNVPFQNLMYNKTYMWVLENPQKFDTPVECANRKAGQVIWVNDAM